MTGLHAHTLLLVLLVVSFAWAVALALHGVADVRLVQTGKGPPCVPAALAWC